MSDIQKNVTLAEVKPASCGQLFSARCEGYALGEIASRTHA